MGRLWLVALLGLSTGCRGSAPSDPGSEPNLQVDVEGAPTNGYHVGPKVSYARSGTRRFVEPLLDTFDSESAIQTAEFADRYYREPANDGFESTIDYLVGELQRAGFGDEPGYELDTHLSVMKSPAWTPRWARLAVEHSRGAESVVLEFGSAGDPSRTMLPVNAPSCNVRGAAAFGMDELDEGEVLVTDQSLGAVLGEAVERGAAAVLSSFLFDFNVDPTGKRRHLDAIHYGSVPSGTTLPVAHISPRAHDKLRSDARGGSKIVLQAEVSLDERPLRTIVATIEGAERAEEAVALVAHVQEPGANDNASGVAGLLEGALALKRTIELGRVDRPRRSVCFVWGDEYTASQVFLDRTEREVLAGLSVDMIGQSESTGAICLLERGPDPGALTPLAPDEHTDWGAGEVDPAHLFPNGLAVIVRTALVDVGIVAGGWRTREHPWEGGSDHDVFLGRGIAAALVWHFTDFAYHTSLDRMDLVDPNELQLTAVAVVAAGCGVADARPGDIKRYVDSVLRERYERLGAVKMEEGSELLAEQWSEWCSGARRWIAALCNGMPLPEPLSPAQSSDPEEGPEEGPEEDTDSGL